MKLSYNWLKDYLEFDLTPARIADAMTDIGIEVDSVEELPKYDSQWIINELCNG